MKNQKVFILTTILLVFVIAFSITKTVKSQDNSSNREMEQYLETLEEEYMETLKLILVENGYYNSGITMTKIIDELGNREYQVDINNKYIIKLSNENQETLIAKLEKIPFEDSNSVFYHEFLDLNQ